MILNLCFNLKKFHQVPTMNLISQKNLTACGPGIVRPDGAMKIFLNGPWTILWWEKKRKGRSEIIPHRLITRLPITSNFEFPSTWEEFVAKPACHKVFVLYVDRVFKHFFKIRWSFIRPVFVAPLPCTSLRSLKIWFLATETSILYWPHWMLFWSGFIVN